MDRVVAVAMRRVVGVRRCVGRLVVLDLVVRRAAGSARSTG